MSSEGDIRKLLRKFRKYRRSSISALRYNNIKRYNEMNFKAMKAISSYNSLIMRTYPEQFV